MCGAPIFADQDFERLIYPDLNLLVELGEYMDAEQHGFWHHFSTLSNMAVYWDYVSKNFENGTGCTAIYTDNSKAFNCAPIYLILRGFFEAGVRGQLRYLLEEILTQKLQVVKVRRSVTHP